MKSSLKAIRLGFRRLADYGDELTKLTRAEKCKAVAYYVGKQGMTHLQWRLAWNVSARLYYRDNA